MTISEKYKVVLSLVAGLEDSEFQALPLSKSEMIEFLESRMKQTTSKKQAKHKIENETLKNLIVIALKRANYLTISEIQSRDSYLNKNVCSTQRMSALLKQLILEGRVVKSYNKKQPVYAAV